MNTPGELSILCSIVISLSCLAGEKPDEAAPRDAEGWNGSKGVIDDPDGYVNLRKEKSTDSPIVAKVKRDEPFEFECQVTNAQRTEHEAWCKVKLASGVTGWMHYSRIKFYCHDKDLPKGPEDSGDEIDQQAREQGVNYYEVTRAAARGDKKALKTFFTLQTDGAAAEFLREQPPEFRENVSFGWELDAFYPFHTKEYFRRHFPRSAKLLFSDRD